MKRKRVPQQIVTGFLKITIPLASLLALFLFYGWGRFLGPGMEEKFDSLQPSMNRRDIRGIFQRLPDYQYRISEFRVEYYVHEPADLEGNQDRTFSSIRELPTTYESVQILYDGDYNVLAVAYDGDSPTYAKTVHGEVETHTLATLPEHTLERLGVP